MNKEEIKELARESMLETLKTNLDSAMIFTYVKSLEDRIDKAIEYIENNQLYEDLTEYDDEINFSYVDDLKATKELLSILRGGDNE